MKAAKKIPPTTKAKPIRDRSEPDLSDVPELTPKQLAGATRRRRGRQGAAAVVSLETVRKGAGLTQAALASRSSMTQAEVSRLETRASLEGVRIETLRRYVEGLGGALELVAVFPSGHRAAVGAAPKT